MEEQTLIDTIDRENEKLWAKVRQLQRDLEYTNSQLRELQNDVRDLERRA